MVKACSTGGSAGAGLTDGRNWKEGLLLRRYHFPPSEDTDQDLATRVEHSGVSFYFPLGTPDPEAAAVKAQQIYDVVVKEGWAAASQRFSRELIVALEWCLQPVLWTYATIHTLVGNRAVGKSNPQPGNSKGQHVLVVEPDGGIRQALCWSINQQAGFCSVPCAGVEAYRQKMKRHRPRLVLLNRKLAGVLGIGNPGTIAPIQPRLPAVTYSVYADGDQMLVSTPGGAGAYLLKRVKPDRLLEPILQVANRSELMTEDFLPRVKCHFQELLQLQSSPDNLALATLTQRERKTLELLSKGCTDKEIAQAMGISPWTVHGHIKKIFERLHVHSRTEAVIRFLEK